MRSIDESNDPVDRLVAGDLSDSERRDLLLRLENDPDGWRSCALAFLEDQAWRQALGIRDTAEPRLGRSPPHDLIELAASKPVWIRRGSLAAAVLLVVFASGFTVGGWIKTTPGTEISTAKPPGSAGVDRDPKPTEIRQVGSFDLIDVTAGESTPLRFPIYSGRGLDDQWLQNLPPSVPDYIRARLEREGYQVAEHRKLMSVQLEDGRQVSIPVDEVELDYIGQQPL